MAKTTRTLNPLHFEDLEPKRFEDLARQLAYDFKTWRQLEATGRAGSDDGFDARGYEIIAPDATLGEEEDDESIPQQPKDRLWLIQCKRERSITPAKVKAHLDAIPSESISELYGFVFIGACDFSKATRDVIRAWATEHGLAECHIWGKAELEDLLFQPKNDHLLFAYFGISLQIRKQKTATQIRQTVTLKRKLNKLFGDTGFWGKPVLLRDISDERFPFTKGKMLVEGNYLWLPTLTTGIGYLGLKVILRRHWAYYCSQEDKWDIASKINRSIPDEHENPWYKRQEAETDQDTSSDTSGFWSSLPRHSQYFFTITGFIPYADIIGIDDVGDDVLKMPTIFLNFQKNTPPYHEKLDIRLENTDNFSPPGNLAKNNHALVFPKTLRDEQWEEGWFARNGIEKAKEPYPIDLDVRDWFVERYEKLTGQKPPPKKVTVID